ncbi:AAA family ATPase [Mesorhizobium sp.]|uniref:AAA family ATPase n=1 Tax=Mesorhizobium sp. TaxID=1871066 RepID=UPI000FE48D6E|nr:AAA family ATPase [Mesorhizobium sp.]RWD98349.1 MAG: AAA family ATPase [Mesorhizobium sp.]
MSLANKYRPTRFSEVLGQPHAVTFLSTVILRKAKPRNLLLFGSHASGKTTLARLYAKALNCSDVVPDGSPCNRCTFCTDVDYEDWEYDVPGTGGEDADIEAWLDGRYRKPTDWKTTVLFFDEAHEIKPKAADSLLKRVEEPLNGVAFVFATTEPKALKNTLRSRLMPLEVRRLGATEAVKLLRHVAEREGIAYDIDGLALLASIKRGYPRDLLIGLDQLGGMGPITLQSVKSMFGLDQTERLVELFLALADGDEARQITILADWPEDVGIMVKWIQSFLTSLFYRDILGVDFIGDPITQSITLGRSEILGRFCRRLDVPSQRDLRPFWEPMLSFWDRPSSDHETELQLRLALFQDLVNRRLGEARSVLGMGSHHAKVESVGTAVPAPAIHPQTSSQGFVEANEQIGQPSNERHSLDIEGIRAIINRASALTQATGYVINAAFEISSYPGIEAPITVASVQRFVRELEEQAAGRPPSLATITLLEAGQFGPVTARICAHLAQLDTPGAQSRVQEWFDSFWQADAGTHHVEMRPSDGKGGMKFHWAEVLGLCAGLGGDSFYPDVGARTLMQNLRVQKARWRRPVAIPYRVLSFNGLVGQDAIEKAASEGMGFLSAYDDRAWRHIKSEWEPKEFLDRNKEFALRRRQIEDLDIFGGDPVQLEEKRIQIRASWSQVKSRPRRWIPWWDHEADA